MKVLSGHFQEPRLWNRISSFDMIVHDRENLNDALCQARDTGEYGTDLRIIHPSGDIKLYHGRFHASMKDEVWHYLAMEGSYRQFFQEEQFPWFFESAEMIFGKRTQGPTGEINRHSTMKYRPQTDGRTLRMYEHTIRNQKMIWSSGSRMMVWSHITIQQP